MEDGKDTDLLELEMDTLWGPDRYDRPGRSRPLVAVAVAVAEGGRAIRVGTDLPGEPLDLAQSRPSAVDGEMPLEIEAYRDRLASMGLDTGHVSAGPSYVVTGESLLRPPIPSGLELLAADRVSASALIPARPQEWWTLQEWGDLVAGHLGPCAIGLVAGRVEAICHTAVASSRAAEAGIWTHPESRKRGYGTAATAAWARMAAPLFDTLFYSTSAENVGSQGIARRLRLRPIGWIWQLRQER